MKKKEELFVLVGCEESQSITVAYRRTGVQAYSCDLKPCSGGHPEFHFQMDVFKVLNGGYLQTQSGEWVFIPKWDAGIFHPDCTYLTNSGVRWLYNADKTHNSKRWNDLGEAINFFTDLRDQCILAGIEHFALENPIPHKYAVNGTPGNDGIGMYDQLFQPYHFGHLEKKATCLWLFNLPELVHTENVYTEMMKLDYKDRAKIHYASPGAERAKLRSKTYQGIADAIAEQYTEFLINQS